MRWSNKNRQYEVLPYTAHARQKQSERLAADADNPVDSILIKPIYAAILRQLTPQDAQVLETLFAHVNTKNYLGAIPMNDVSFFSAKAIKVRAINYIIQLPRLRAEEKALFGLENFNSVIDRLLRQRLLFEVYSRQVKGYLPQL